MILPFDEFGNLPDGIHDATVAEMASRFGRSSQRDKILADVLRIDIACFAVFLLRYPNEPEERHPLHNPSRRDLMMDKGPIESDLHYRGGQEGLRILRQGLADAVSIPSDMRDNFVEVQISHLHLLIGELESRLADYEVRRANPTRVEPALGLAEPTSPYKAK